MLVKRDYRQILSSSFGCAWLSFPGTVEPMELSEKCKLALQAGSIETLKLFERLGLKSRLKDLKMLCQACSSAISIIPCSSGAFQPPMFSSQRIKNNVFSWSIAITTDQELYPRGETNPSLKRKSLFAGILKVNLVPICKTRSPWWITSVKIISKSS